MFDGKVRQTKSYVPRVSRRGKQPASQQNFLEEQRALRESRERERKVKRCAVLIQARWRRFRSWKALLLSFRSQYDTQMANILNVQTVFQSKGMTFKVPSEATLKLCRLFALIHRYETDEQRLTKHLQLYLDFVSHAENIKGILSERGVLQSWFFHFKVVLIVAFHSISVAFRVPSEMASPLTALCVRSVQTVQGILRPAVAANESVAHDVWTKSTEERESSLLHLDVDDEDVQFLSQQSKPMSLASVYLKGILASLTTPICDILSNLIDHQYKYGAISTGNNPIREQLCQACLEIVLCSLKDYEKEAQGLVARFHAKSASFASPEVEVRAAIEAVFTIPSTWMTVLNTLLSRPGLVTACSQQPLLFPLLRYMGAKIGVLVSEAFDPWHIAIFLQRLYLTAHKSSPQGQEQAQVTLSLVDNYLEHMLHEYAAPSAQKVIDAVLTSNKKMGLWWLHAATLAMEAEDTALPRQLSSLLYDGNFIAGCFRGLMQSVQNNEANFLSLLMDACDLYGKLIIREHQHKVAPVNINTMQPAVISLLPPFVGPRVKNATRNLYLMMNNHVGLHICERLVPGNPTAPLFGSTNRLFPQSKLKVLFCFFVQALSYQLELTDDEEFFGTDCIIGSQTDVLYLITMLNRMLYHYYKLRCSAATGINDNNNGIGNKLNSVDEVLRKAGTHLFNQLYDINERNHQVLTQKNNDVWFMTISDGDYLDIDNIKDFNTVQEVVQSASSAANGMGGDVDVTRGADADADAGMEVDGASPLGSPATVGDGGSGIKNSVTWRAVLDHPQVLPFKKRVELFQRLLDIEKRETNQQAGFFPFAYSTRLSVRRDHVVEDAMEALQNLNQRQLQGRIQVEFVSSAGYTEAGIDGGGLFKEFLDDLIKTLFQPDFGLFDVTADQLLLPRGGSHLDLRYFNFAGKMLGKAIFDNILMEPQFSPLLLNILLGRTNFFDDLAFYDAQLYKSMKQVKQMAEHTPQDIASLGLFFDATTKVMDPATGAYTKIETRELYPGGSSVAVDHTNYREYLRKFADYKLNGEFTRQVRAFKAGLTHVIPLEWVHLFSSSELQQLISGEAQGIDVDDITRHVQYAGGYHPSQPYVQAFWAIVREMTPTEQGNLLKFVTSCSRQPLRGFASLEPLIAIQKVPQYSQENMETSRVTPRLPSASTCVNLLKLPQYDDVATLKEKLMYAVMNNNAGFELS